MSTILRSVFRNSALKSLANSLRQNEACSSKRQFTITRNFWNASSSANGEGRNNSVFRSVSQSNMCSCGCGLRHAHSKGYKELVDFLNEEIVAETKLLKSNTIPVELEGFKVKLDGSDVTLTKSVGDEQVEVTFNINHSIDTDSEPELNTSQNNPGEMKSKPRFEIDVKRGKTTLGFTCSFVLGREQQSDEGYNDVFAIDEVTLYEGEWQDKHYSVSGEVLDGYLYDLLMNLLDDKGVTNEFVEKLSEFSTIYEHNSYISLLEGIKKFAGTN